MSAVEPAPRRSLHPLEAAAYVVITLAGMKAAAGLINPFLLALLLSLMCIGPMRWLQKRRVPDALSVLVTVVGAVVLVTGLAALVGTSVGQFLESLPEIDADLDAFRGRALSWLEARGVPVPGAERVKEILDPAPLLGLVGDTMSGVLGILSDAFVIGLMVVFMLFEAAGFPRKLRRALGDQRADLTIYRRAMRNVSDYVAVKTWVSLLTGALVSLTMWALDVDYPVLWGVIAFAFNFVPNIGSLIAAVPGVLYALAERGVGPAAGAAAAYLVINFGIGNVLEPRLMGNRLGLSTLVVFLSLLVWSWVLGPVGLLISAPLTAIVKIVLEASRDYRAIAVLLGPADEPPPPEPPPASSAASSGA